MVGTRRVIGSGEVVISVDKVAEMASTNQFFNFILERFTFLYGIAMVSVIAAVFSLFALGGVVVLCGDGMRSACKASSRRRDLWTFRGPYVVKRGCQGCRGLKSGRGGYGEGVAVKGA